MVITYLNNEVWYFQRYLEIRFSTKTLPREYELSR